MESEQESDDISKGLNIYQRLREVRREVTGVTKAGKHTHGFRFITHDDVTAALSGLYVKWGIDREVSVEGHVREGQVLSLDLRIDWVNVDNPSDRKSVHVYSEGIDQGTRKDGSLNVDGLAAGKAMSYAVKMAELKNFCLTGDSTPDNERTRSDDSPPPPPPSSEEYKQLVELYKSCSTIVELQKIREVISPLVQRKVLTDAQMQELSKLDTQAKANSK